MGLEKSVGFKYSGSNLGVWFERASCDWEKYFRKEELEYGRILYKKGVIRDIELHVSEALAQARFEDGSEPYCVLDFNGIDYVRRFDDLDSSALAVAVFYEIDEFIADTISFDGIDAFEDTSSQEEAVEEIEEETEDAEDVEQVREIMPLVLTFHSRRKGLVFSCKWELPDGSLRSAYGEKGIPIDELAAEECEKLLTLAGLARKAGFKYDGEYHVLAELSKIPPFLNTILPKWEVYFKILKNEKVELLRGGERKLEIVPEAIALDSNDTDFDISWTSSVDGKEIDSSELHSLFSGAGTLKILPEYGILRISSSDAAFARTVERSREYGFKDGKIPRYMLLSLSEFGGGMKLTPKLKKWKKSLEEGCVSIDKSLPEFLRNYQKRGVEWALNLFEHSCNVMIADEMGLGKTLQTLTIADSILRSERGKGVKSPKFLVVCPASVIPVWISEAKKFFPQNSATVLTSKSDFSKSDLLIASYTQLRRNKAKVEKTKFALAVLDEAQFIKNPDAKTTVACMTINAERKVALTGTPLENKLLDIWTAFRWLMPGLLGGRANFERLAEGDSTAVDTVRKQISPFVLRRMKAEVAAELPEKVQVDLICPMTELQKSEYTRLLTEARSCLKSANSDAKGRFTVLSLLTRLRQAACDVALLPWIDKNSVSETGGKLSVLLDRVEELFNGNKKVVVFSQFTKFIDIAKSALIERIGAEKIYTLTGTTRDRATPVRDFQNSKKGAVIFVSLRAGGTGITLSEADYIFLADPWWNPAVEEQAIDRAHRIGRRGDVFVYRMIAQDSVEDRVRKLQATKRKLFNDLIGGLRDISLREKFVETIAEILK